jgi:hypothetical protein
MAGVAHNVTVSLPSGSLSEVFSISASTGGLSVGYNTTYNPNAGTLTLNSYDDPGSTIGQRGALSISGDSIDLSFDRAYVSKVDTSATTKGAVTFTTTVKLIDTGSS